MEPDDRKVVVISGVTGALGSLLASHLSKQGMRIVGLSRRKPFDNQHDMTHYCLDIRKPEEIEQVVEKIFSDLGPVYGLINCAGVITSMHSLIIPEKSITDMIDTNLVGALLLSRAVARRLTAVRQGRIIFVGSMASTLKPRGDAMYGVSKHSVLGLSEHLGREIAGFGITCNSIVITALRNGMGEKIDQDALSEIMDSLPIPGWPVPSDITNIVDFYLADESHSITCQSLALGGLSV